MMFQSKSTMNMNAAVQELERFNARRNAHAVDNGVIDQFARRGMTIRNYITVSDVCRLRQPDLFVVVYQNSTCTQEPFCSLPRGSVIGIDHVLVSAEGPWLHIFDNTMIAEGSLRGSKRFHLIVNRMDSCR